MRILDFTGGRELLDQRLEGVRVAPLTTSIASGARVQAAVFTLAAGGRIARHAAGVPQLFVVVEGSGRVSGGDAEERAIGAGAAAYWEAGEEHETSTDAGLTAVVLEGEGLEPSSSAAATT